jgi:hypothetical protein
MGNLADGAGVIPAFRLPGEHNCGEIYEVRTGEPVAREESPRSLTTV